MPYGRTPHRGHGRRKPAHRWAEDPSFLDRHCRDDIYDLDDGCYLYEHSHSPWYLEAVEDTNRIILLLASMALYAAGAVEMDAKGPGLRGVLPARAHEDETDGLTPALMKTRRSG